LVVAETVIAFVLGLIAGGLALALLRPTMNRRVSAKYQAEIDQYQYELSELRQERADDRETNRRLRRELAINTPHTLQSTREARDRAVDELEKLHSELHKATSELADRDRSLREARLAIHDIRVQLERDRFAMGDHSAAGDVNDDPEGYQPAPFGSGKVDSLDDDYTDDDYTDDDYVDDDDADGDGYEAVDGGQDGEGPARTAESRFFDDYPVGGSAQT
jgi:uncharacterized membrane-anchored protein YhcB (DUF1043 family)